MVTCPTMPPFTDSLSVPRSEIEVLDTKIAIGRNTNSMEPRSFLLFWVSVYSLALLHFCRVATFEAQNNLPQEAVDSSQLFQQWNRQL